MPARISATSAARPDKITSAMKPSASGVTAGRPRRARRVSMPEKQRELADEARERRQPGEQQRAADEAEAEDRHGARAAPSSAGRLVGVELLVAEAVGLGGDRQHRRDPARSRSTSSTSRKNALIASVELTR